MRLSSCCLFQRMLFIYTLPADVAPELHPSEVMLWLRHATAVVHSCLQTVREHSSAGRQRQHTRTGTPTIQVRRGSCPGSTYSGGTMKKFFSRKSKRASAGEAGDLTVDTPAGSVTGSLTGSAQSMPGLGKKASSFSLGGSSHSVKAPGSGDGKKGMKSILGGKKKGGKGEAGDFASRRHGGPKKQFEVKDCLRRAGGRLVGWGCVASGTAGHDDPPARRAAQGLRRRAGRASCRGRRWRSCGTS